MCGGGGVLGPIVNIVSRSLGAIPGAIGAAVTGGNPLEGAISGAVNTLATAAGLGGFGDVTAIGGDLFSEIPGNVVGSVGDVLGGAPSAVAGASALPSGIAAFSAPTDFTNIAELASGALEGLGDLGTNIPLASNAFNQVVGSGAGGGLETALGASSGSGILSGASGSDVLLGGGANDILGGGAVDPTAGLSTTGASSAATQAASTTGSLPGAATGGAGGFPNVPTAANAYPQTVGVPDLSWGQSIAKWLGANPYNPTVKAIANNPGAIIGAGNLARSVFGGNSIPGMSNLKGLAENAAARGEQLSSYLTSGTLPPGAQEAIKQATAGAKAAIRSKYAQMGMSGSTSEVQELNAVDERAAGQAFALADNLLRSGLDSSGLASNIYNALIQNEASQNRDVGGAIANFAAAASGVRA